jgi:DNA-binding Lrp family transcriptional regulator
MKIDETDRKLLYVLMDNSRLSYRQIAKKIGVSVATVMHRVNSLEAEKVIKGYTTILDYDQLGYDVDVIINIKVAKGKLFEVEKKIAISPNVSDVYDSTGDFDAVVVAKFKNRKKLDNFLKKIQTYDFIETTHTVLILNTIKRKEIVP